MRVKINITKYALKRYDVRNTENCPIAVAVRRLCKPGQFVRVGCSYVRFGDAERDYVYDRSIRRVFDRKPYSFMLNLPKAVLR